MRMQQIGAYGRSLAKIAKGYIKAVFRRLPGVGRLISLGDRMAVLEQTLSVLRASIKSRMQQQENRIRGLEEEGESPHLATTSQSSAPAAAALTAAGLEFLMAHAHLPAPPSRVLDQAGILEHGGLNLSSLGYEIHQSRLAAGATNDWNAIVCRLEDKPSADQEELVTNALRELCTGGRLILSLPLRNGQKPPAWLGRLPAREVVHASRDESVWTFTAAGEDCSGLGESLVFGVVEKH